ncbi:MAG: TolB family protein [Sporichthyaceae bacterium]
MRRRDWVGVGAGALTVALSLGAWAGASGAGATPGLSLVSTDAAGAPLQGFGWSSALSGDGRHLALAGSKGLVVKDLGTGAVDTVCSRQCGNPALSHDGRYLAFDTPAGGRVGKRDVVVQDLRTGTKRLVTGAIQFAEEGHAYVSGLSADGRRVVFWSGDGRRQANAWAADERAQATLIGRKASGLRLSADGNTAVFSSKAYEGETPRGTDGTRHLQVVDLRTGTRTPLSALVDLGVTPEFYAIQHSAPSADGSRLALTVRTNRAGTNPDWSGLYVVDLRTGKVVHRVRTRDGRIAYGHSPELSADGRHLLFGSGDDTLVARDLSLGFDVFVTDLRTDSTRKISSPRLLRTDGVQYTPATSADPLALSADGAAALFSSGDEQTVGPRRPASGYWFGGVYLVRADESARAAAKSTTRTPEKSNEPAEAPR